MSPHTSRIRSQSSRMAQDNVLDRIAAGEIASVATRRIALSLRPDEAVAMANAMGEPYARAIVDAWRPAHKILVLQAQEFDAMVERGRVTFHGQAADVDDKQGVDAENASEVENA